jgi:Rad3-related DNA helicase
MVCMWWWRQVVIVGVPFPNWGDAKVQLKRKYQDANGGGAKGPGRSLRAVAGGEHRPAPCLYTAFPASIALVRPPCVTLCMLSAL